MTNSLNSKTFSVYLHQEKIFSWELFVATRTIKRSPVKFVVTGSCNVAEGYTFAVSSFIDGTKRAECAFRESLFERGKTQMFSLYSFAYFSAFFLPLPVQRASLLPSSSLSVKLFSRGTAGEYEILLR